MNCLLINPPLAGISTTNFYVMPPGLLSLAAFVRKYGFSVNLLDLNIKEHNSFFEGYINQKPSVVGVSVMVAGQFQTAYECLKYVKHTFPEIVTIMGGAHASQFPKKILKNCPEVDFVVIGEGEQQLLDCIYFAENKKFVRLPPDGLAYREDDIVVKPKTKYIQDLDKLPFPAYDLIKFKDYAHDVSTWHNPYQDEFGVRVPIITSRGCPNLCNFCSVAKCMGLSYRMMSPAKVVDMIQMLYEYQKIKYFAIFDANFAQDANRVISICEEINKRNIKIYIDLPTGLPINATAVPMIEALASVGLIRTCISVESGDDFIRNKVMKKNVAQDSIFEVIKSIRKYPQIFLLIDFVLGMPEDTVQSLEASCSLIEMLDVDDVEISIATPYPGTALYQQCKKENLFFDNVDESNLWKDQSYSHANTKRFIIKPYNLDLKTLYQYRERIIAARLIKTAGYQKRMYEKFNIMSNYRGKT